MEKNIRKRICRLAAVLSAVLVVLFGYWFFLNPHGYWQKQKEAEKEEYSERRMLWRKSETMTMQRIRKCERSRFAAMRFVYRLDC